MKTISYNEQTNGWPSFYSFYPEWMIGMNNRFYSFKGGNLFEHNASIVYNSWYDQVSDPSIIQFCVNKEPLVAKLFKAIALESDTQWTAQIQTDEQAGGVSTINYYEKKEGMWFSNIRYNTTAAPASRNIKNRSVVGMGGAVITSGGATVRIFTFTSPVSDTVSIGDGVAYIVTTSPSSIFSGGTISNISADRTVVTATGSASPAAAAVNIFAMATKDPVAESYGLLGDYAIVTLIESTSGPSELFSAEFDVMKSFP